MTTHTATNNFGIENSNEVEAALSADLVVQDLSELALMGAVVSQPNSELALNLDRPTVVVDSSNKPVALDLEADSPAKVNVVSNSSDLSLVNIVMTASESAPMTYTVTNSNDSGVGSLREAIFLANQNAGIDTVLVNSDVTLTSAINITDGVNLISLDGYTITQTGSDRIFNINDGDANNDIQVSLRNLDLTGGSPVATGGAILSYEALTIKNSSFYGNATTLRGGAIYQEDGSLNIAGSRFYENAIALSSGTSAGGAIYAKNTELSVVNTKIEDNSSFVGGGIAAFDDVEATVADSILQNNNGGGIAAAINVNIDIDNSQFKYNYADISGGGLGLERNATATVTNSTFEGNSARYGGGIEVLDNSKLVLTDSSVTGNSGRESGGGIDVYDNSVVEVTNSTITGNSSDFGGGIASYDGTSDITLTNTVVTGNAINNLEGDGFTIIETEDLNQDIFGDNQDNTLEGNDLDNHIKGRGGKDTLLGGVGNDTLRGNSGNDVLYGGNGDDRLLGGNGNDTFYGGDGYDVFKGGQGNDLFVIGEGTSKILDFEVGTDTIGLSDGLSYEDLTAVGGKHTRFFVNGDLVAIVRDVNQAELSTTDFTQV